MPPDGWEDYNCKVLIRTNDALDEFSSNTDTRARDTWGYLYIIPEQFGFNKFVKVIV